LIDEILSDKVPFVIILFFRAGAVNSPYIPPLTREGRTGNHGKKMLTFLKFLDLKIELWKDIPLFNDKAFQIP